MVRVDRKVLYSHVAQQVRQQIRGFCSPSQNEGVIPELLTAASH